MTKEISYQSLKTQDKQMQEQGIVRLEIVRILMAVCQENEGNNLAFIKWLLSSTLED